MCHLQKTISNFLVITQNLKLYVSSSVMVPLFSSWQMLSFSSATIFSDLQKILTHCWAKSLSDGETTRYRLYCNWGVMQGCCGWLENDSETFMNEQLYPTFTAIWIRPYLVFMYEDKADSRKQRWKPAWTDFKVVNTKFYFRNTNR